MKQTIQRAKVIWQYLDAPSGKGQSLVELALIMPLLVILVAGLMEIGYFANNYINLTEVARSVARSATTLQNEMSPMFWEDVDTGLFRGSEVEPADSVLRQAWIDKYRNCNPLDTNASIGFYNFLGCITLLSMNPMRITGFEPGASTTDDIIISGFTVVPDEDKMVVTRRYPFNAAECIPDSKRETLGFTWGGNYVNSQGCLGSEFTNAEVEQLMNLNQFVNGVRPSNLVRYMLPQGVVIVELHWQHETLSQFVGLAPAVSPVFSILGVSTNIYVWAAFPLPTVEREE